MTKRYKPKYPVVKLNPVTQATKESQRKMNELIERINPRPKIIDYKYEHELKIPVYEAR